MCACESRGSLSHSSVLPGHLHSCTHARSHTNPVPHKPVIKKKTLRREDSLENSHVEGSRGLPGAVQVLVPFTVKSA